MRIDCAFPGGNILVERIEGQQAFLRQDLRDTEGDWFYWSFRVRGASGRRVSFTFTGSDVIGTQGPAQSLDGGRNWSWLGRAAVQGQTFSCQVPPGVEELRLCFCIPYQEWQLRDFLARFGAHPSLRAQILCRTPKGREVELLRVGRLDGAAAHRIFLSARHHACESTPNYVLEGLLEEVLAGAEWGPWLREQVEFLVVPFMDKDGVEEGDQGKNRRPHDHNRDYAGESRYASVQAVRAQIPRLGGGRLRLALDLHCPWIRGLHNEEIYLVGSKDPANWARACAFAQLLQESISGELPYRVADNLPWGQAWNTSDGPQKSCARWAAEIPGIWIATSMEIPYASVHQATVTAANARHFGRDLARALVRLLGEGGPGAGRG